MKNCAPERLHLSRPSGKILLTVLRFGREACLGDGIVFDEISYQGSGPGSATSYANTLTDIRSQTNREVLKIFQIRNTIAG